MDETLSISDAVYEAEWYKADASTMKDVRFILARSQSPICLDALPLGSLNYPLFLLIIKTSYSYLTLMMETT
ncbi:hypothetical protein NQ314_007844 [Rhamnusium bicolor]|uniref:Uncharacterized protein n=1 Tax=Rhamnusium bicolor TaxID=1586634 RepID=A0AAV8YHA8_9CUCU|nr:hypothetical protein NQ314_007844 [Rhamnusium bicolor]